MNQNLSVHQQKEIPSSIIKYLFSNISDKKSIGLKELETFFKSSVDVNSEDSIEMFVRNFKNQTYEKIDPTNLNAKKGVLSALQLIINLVNLEKQLHFITFLFEFFHCSFFYIIF